MKWKDKCGGFAALRNLGADLAISGAVLFGATSCQAPAVSARAVWVDVRRGVDGERTLHTYDRGEISHRTIAPLEVDLPMFSMALGPKGRYLLIRGTDGEGTVLDMQSGRNLPLHLQSAWGVDRRLVRFTDRGDALAWLDGRDQLNLVSLSPTLIVNRDAGEGVPAIVFPNKSGTSWILSAGDAPRVVGYRAASREMFAVSYPDEETEAEHGALTAADLVIGKAVSSDDLVQNPGKRQMCFSMRFGDCRSNYSIDPSGTVVTVAIAASGNQDDDDDNAVPENWIRWNIGSKSNSVERLELPTEMRDSGAQLLSQLDANTYLFADTQTIYRWNRKNEQLDRLVILAGESYSYWKEVDNGRRLVWLNLIGSMLTIDREGISPVNRAATTCIEPSSPVISPSGRFAAWTCEPIDVDSQTPQALTSTVLRVSASGLEIFRGISMSVLAIDDGGNLLMNSETRRLESDEEIDEYENLPRILYVLTSDGLLFEVDNLEPSPEQIEIIDQKRKSFILARSYQ